MLSGSPSVPCAIDSVAVAVVLEGCCVVGVEFIDRLALGTYSGGEYCVLASTEVGFFRLRSSSTARRFGAEVGVCWLVILEWTDDAGLET